MSIFATFNGITVISTPTDPKPQKFKWDAVDVVGSTTNNFTGQQQVFDWSASWLEGEVTLPPMFLHQAAAWIAFLQQCAGTLNAFLIADTAQTHPLQPGPVGAPEVDGSVPANNMPGSRLLYTKGWLPGRPRLLLPGDLIQLGAYRMHRVLDVVASDANGKATLRIWPVLREQPSDGAAIDLNNVAGLFRLIANKRSWSIQETQLFGITFQVREALPIT